jgi:signal transduction histidine kinase
VCRRLSLAEGLDYRACSGAGQPVVSQAPDGRIWFVNQRSVGVFDPGIIPDAESPVHGVIESVTVDGVEWPVRAGEPLRVPSKARRFEFRFTALNLPRPAEARFRHRLTDVDPGWVDAGDQRVAYYSPLPPGKYTFEVEAGGADGVWHAARPSLVLEVVPQLWERAVVRVGAVVLLLAGVAGGVGGMARARLRRRLALIERQRALEQERSRIARDMHDELGAGLTQISFLTALANDSADDAAEVRTQGSKIARVARHLVQSLDEIVWAVRPQNDNLESLVEYLGQATRDLCEGSGVRCWFAVPPAVPAVEVPANARHNVILACREAVNNVLKHSGATELRMTVRLEERRLTVELTDNGHGFDVATGEAKRSGLTHMRARLGEVGGGCEFHSATPGGTTVRFLLPLGATHA